MTSPLPEPQEVRATFRRLLERDPEKATAYLYGLGMSSGYIKREAIARTIRWTSESPYGTLECTINRSKPEKDPRAIAAAAEDRAEGAAVATPAAAATEAASSAAATEAADSAEVASSAAATGYPPYSPPSAGATPIPRCDLCWDNEGFPGTAEHPAKPGLRIAEIPLGGERWGLQYSPYAYFPEHCIALSEEHRPMRIDAAGFERLLDFVDLFPFYFIGSNADMPIVGGSILSHDHFQGGRHTFPLMKAPVEHAFKLRGARKVSCGIVRWPASVVRLASENRAELLHAAARVLEVWQSFSFEPCSIQASSTGRAGKPVCHNTLNPIVRKVESTYIMDLVLRNNRTDAEHPFGIFHPGETLHHIKKENIGLIEIMGLAILPPRLAAELPAVQLTLAEAASKGLPPNALERHLLARSETAPHAAWAADVHRRRATDLLDSGDKLSPAASSGFDLSEGSAKLDSRKSRAAGKTLNEPPAQPCELHPVIQEEVGSVFAAILETTGVFKRDEAGQEGWAAFLEELGRS